MVSNFTDEELLHLEEEAKEKEAANKLNKHLGSFSRLNQEIKPVNIIAFDTEDDTKGTPLSCAFYGDEGHFYTTSMEEAIDYIYNTPVTTCFVAHNLEYDVGNLFKHVDWKYIEDMMYAGKLLRAGLFGSKHYFINSNSFFAGPLKKMGDTIGLPKLEGDVENPEYVIRDAEIVYTFMKKFQKYLNEELHINLGITIGQLAMSAYRRNYMPKLKQKTYNSPNCLKAYYGGRVEIFFKGAAEDVRVSDINSSYPNVMYNFTYPDTGTIKQSTIGTHEYGIGKFKISVPGDIFIPPLPVKSPEKRLFFPTGVFKGWWTYPEVRYAQALGCEILEEYEGEGTNQGCRPFTNFIDEFYNKRLDAKSRGDDFEVLFYKLFMNNLYGKWCQHKGGSTIGREPLTATKAQRQNAILERKIGAFYSYKSQRTKPPLTANFMWGVYITAYARIELMKGMNRIHDMGGKLIYCDTDSIMFSGLKKNPLPLSKKLGDWDEEKFDLGYFRQAKGYLLCQKKGPRFEIEKVACKGVNTDYAYDFIVRGMASVMKPMRFKDSMVRINAAVNSDKDAKFLKELGVNVWNDVDKMMKSIYIKREGEGGVMYPIDFKDIKRVEEANKDHVRELEKQLRDGKKPNLSVEKELREKGYFIKRKRIKKYFQNIQVPDNWFKRGKERDYEVKFFESQYLRWLRREDCENLPVGHTWFQGHFHSTEQGKYGRFYKILLTEYKNQPCPPNIWAAISVKFFRAIGYDQNLVGFFVDTKLRKIYVDKKPLILDVSISESELCARSDEEITDVEHLSEEETENLAGADWSFLDVIPK